MADNGGTLQPDTGQPACEEDTLADYIPQLHEPQCCCGNVACTFLRETQAAFDRLDESLRTAGRLGQALLVRHETYVAEAEAERKHMREEIDRLAQDRDALQNQNNAVIDENRELLEQLESANNAVTDSDSHVKSLTATLQTAQQEIHRLNTLSRRTQSLERELELFELEQTKLQSSLATKTEQERAANLRWQHAERQLANFEDRIEAIEQEARAEREHHVEIIGRLERRRVVEKELDTAAGRLKSAAAGQSSNEHGNTGVVSHFVKDILQDNANLQLNVVELRELLTNANGEVELLRDQLLEHLPSPDPHATLPTDGKPPAPLSQEMSRSSTAQEVHVHHHYHAPASKPDPARRNSQNIRRPKRRRQGISFGNFTPSSGHRTPSNLSISTAGFPTPATTITPSSGQPQSHRWSVYSMAAQSSVPSSPRSYRSPSLFDRPFSDAEMDSSRPTTPGTEAGDSPYFMAFPSKRGLSSFFQPLDETIQEDTVNTLGIHNVSTKDASSPDGSKATRVDSPTSNKALEEDDEEDPEHSLVDFTQPVPRVRPLRMRVGRPMSFTDDDLPSDTTMEYQSHSLHRAASHESLLSVSGMDIHTLKSRPSQMLTGHAPRSFSAEATISSTIAQADRPSLNSKSSHTLLADMEQRAGSAQSPATGLGKRVSGWMFGRWASSPHNPSPLNPARNSSAPEPTASAKLQEVRNQVRIRPPGINQPGAILGFLADHPSNRQRPTLQLTKTTISREPIMQILNEEELRQSLSER
ncbi:hypothetical protein BDZ85DRAFT_261632 [Elsinoe ampelina]|uniref:Uncharacterized protein n=1 Tax=Elsinoe ampelina TaxID=302913 RepID=A0A6A6GCL7_9PEZI|nr:hypothetical protein BDZ85DRAFT_261632 [Elsinoe ampelina]